MAMMKKRAAGFLVVAVLLTPLLASDSYAGDVPPLIRLHILANSDSERDQYLKSKVRDRIVLAMAEKLGRSAGLDESRKILLDGLDSLEQEAGGVLRELGCGDEVNACYGVFEFPTKYYGGLVLPAGRYEAIKLVIGEGRGSNWWCVLFPPLCLVKVNSGQAAPVSRSIDKSVDIKPVLAVTKLWDAVMARLNKK